MEEVWRGAQEIGERGVGRNVKAGSAGSCRGRGGPGVSPGQRPHPLCCRLASSMLGGGPPSPTPLWRLPPSRSTSLPVGASPDPLGSPRQPPAPVAVRRYRPAAGGREQHPPGPHPAHVAMATAAPRLAAAPTDPAGWTRGCGPRDTHPELGHGPEDGGHRSGRDLPLTRSPSTPPTPGGAESPL